MNDEILNPDTWDEIKYLYYKTHIKSSEKVLLKFILKLKQEIDDLRKENLELHNLNRLIRL